MPKHLTTFEIFQALEILEENIGDEDQHKEFTKDLAEVLCKHGGGEVDEVYCAGNDTLSHAVINIDRHVPADGGVFAQFHTEVIWKDGEEK